MVRHFFEGEAKIKINSLCTQYDPYFFIRRDICGVLADWWTPGGAGMGGGMPCQWSAI
jgi:hypothetical protein